MSSGDVSEVIKFLKEKREINDAVCEKFRTEKMDIAAVKEAKDEELHTLGLIHRGDVLALRAFAERGTNEDRVQKKRNLLQSLKEKFSGERQSKKRKNSTLPAEKGHSSTSSKSAFRKVYAGWQHYDKKQKRYVSVRLVNGGGMREIDADVNATKDEIIQQMKSVFFSDGNCAFGKTYEMHFTLGNFKCEEITEEDFTLTQYIARHRLSKCRLYILTKRYEDMIWSDSENEEDVSACLPKDVLNKPTKQKSNGTGTSSNGSHLSLSKQKTECPDSQANDQEKDMKEENNLSQSEEEEDANEKLFKLRAAIVPPELCFDEDSITVSVRHVSLGLQVRRFSMSNRVSSIYDWVGSLSRQPRSFKLSTCDIAYLDPDMPVTMVDKTLVRMAEIAETPMVRLSPGYEAQSLQNNPPFNIPSPTEILPEILLQSEDVVDETHEVIPGDHTSQDYNVPTNAETRKIKIRRSTIMQDMINEFRDETILNAHIKVVMINGFGKEELGVDNGGVFRDALSAFWSIFYDSCTVGEAERVPVIRHDFKEDEWEAIGRIVVKGYQEVKYFPVLLNKVFIFSTIFDGKDIPYDLLLKSFLAYLSKDERDLVQAALNEEDMDETQNKEFLDFLENFGARRIPGKDGRRGIILELAHKELVQRAQFVIDNWKKPLRQGLGNITCFSSIESVNMLYESSTPTVKRVLNLIAAETYTNAQRDVVSYLRRYVRGMDDEKLAKFLRFCTGASMICVDEIRVSFSDLTGAARRPVAHTCGCVLELPVSYESFPQFREEMNNLFSSQYWDIDIA